MALVLTVLSSAGAAPPASNPGLRRPDEPHARAGKATWSKEVLGVFFDDARELLVGTRPRPSDPEARRPPWHDPPDTAHAAHPLSVVWSRIISAAAIENEIKALKQLVDGDLKTPGSFRGGGYRKCHDHFSLLAAMFRVVAQYDEDVRWKRDAPGMARALARAAAQCKVGSDASYREAQFRTQQLESLVRGQPLHLNAADQDRPWSRIAARPPLMRRLEKAHQQRLTPWLSSAQVFKQNRERIVSEAELMAALAQMIQFEDYEFWDDEGYLEPARQLQGAARDLARAAHEGNLDMARRAAAAAGKACSQCHDGYRITTYPRSRNLLFSERQFKLKGGVGGGDS